MEERQYTQSAEARHHGGPTTHGDQYSRRMQHVTGQSAGLSLPITHKDKARVMSDEASGNYGRPTQYASEVQSAADNYLYPTPPTKEEKADIMSKVGKSNDGRQSLYSSSVQSVADKANHPQ